MTGEFIQNMSELHDKLSRCPSATRYDKPSKSEAKALTHGLCDIKEECENYLNDLFPKLLKAETEEEIVDRLQDICHALRHVHYHLMDSEYLESFMGVYEAEE